MAGPLEGITVLDFSHLLPGDLCSTMLADLGCEVIRIEPLDDGLGKSLPPIVEGESLCYWSLHRNKRRIGLDLKSTAGVETILKLLARADVVLENFRPGVMDRLGLGYEAICERNPGIIYCSISGYGAATSNSGKVGHDLNFIAESGVLDRAGDALQHPRLPGILISDYFSGHYASLSVVACLFERMNTGRGRKVDISMWHSALAMLAVDATRALYEDGASDRSAAPMPAEMVNYRTYICADGRSLAVGCLERKFWETFCERIGRADLKNRQPEKLERDLFEIVEAVIAAKSLDEWIEIFEGANCCVSPVLTLKEAMSSTLAAEIGAVGGIRQEKLGFVPQLLSPLRLFGCETQPYESKSLAGDTANTLRRLGFSKVEIDSLAAKGAIASLSSVRLS